MKQIYKIKFLLLLTLLLGGVIVSQQAEAQSTTALFYESFDKISGTGGNDGSFSGNVANGTLTDDSYDNKGWILTKGSGASKCIKLGASSTLGSATTPTIAFVKGKTYTISFRAGAWKGDATTLNVSTTAGELSESTVTLANSKMQDYTLTLTATGEGTVTFKAKQASKNRFFLDEVKVTAEGEAKTQTKLTFSTETYTYSESSDDAKAFTGQTATLTDAEGKAVEGSVTYSSSNTELATVDETTGKVSIVDGQCGIATITAEYAGNDTYASSKATYTITINPALTGDGTQNNPYTVSDIQKLFAVNNLPSDNVYVKGLISQIKEVSTSYGNASYYISDDGGSTNQLYVYRGLYLENAKFTSSDQIAVGDEVVVYGSASTYNNEPQLGNGNYLVTLKHTESEVVEMTVAQAIAELDKDDYTKNQVIIKGIISKIDEISTSYGNATYYISDDGTTASQLEVYHGYGLDGAKFTSTTALHVGDKVQVKGYIILYNGTTKEVNSGSSLVSLDCPHVEVAISAAGYASLYYGTTALVVPEDVKVVTYTVSEGKLTESHEYAAGAVIPAATGVVISGSEGSYFFTKTADEGTADANNSLKGSDEEATTTGGDVYYKLSLNAAEEEGSVGFYYGAADGAAFTNGAHKAYLALSTAQAVNILGFAFNGAVETGLSTIAAGIDATNAAIFDLQGRRVNAATKGIYIVNGRKLIK